MLRWLYALAAGSILSGFAFLLLTGRYSNDGPTVTEVAPGRGLHAGDFFIIAGWAVGILAIALLVVLSSPRRGSSRGEGRIPSGGRVVRFRPGPQ